MAPNTPMLPSPPWIGTRSLLRSRNCTSPQGASSATPAARQPLMGPQQRGDHQLRDLPALPRSIPAGVLSGSAGIEVHQPEARVVDHILEVVAQLVADARAQYSVNTCAPRLSRSTLRSQLSSTSQRIRQRLQFAPRSRPPAVLRQVMSHRSPGCHRARSRRRRPGWRTSGPAGSPGRTGESR